MSDRLLTVTQLNEYLKMMMDSNPFLADVFVRGEISNFTHHYKTGHFYFSVKDETGALRAVMFRSAAQNVLFKPENGMRVILRGRVSVFPRDGQYQIYVGDMQPDGIGALYIAYEQLRRKLEAEGLFDPSKKKPIPKFPKTIGIVTSPTGAAVRDMIDILGRRFPLVRVILYPALVQGQGAAASVASGIRFFNEKMPVDVMIVGRGGGSIEDLWAFNEEVLARAVAASSIPVISAVGHETDVTLCDFVADLRAPTPSAAAELAVPDLVELKRLLGVRASYLVRMLSSRIEAARGAVNALAAARSLRSPVAYIDDKRMALTYLSEKLDGGVRLALLKQKNRFSSLCSKLEALNPLGVLLRGYAVVFDEQGSALSGIGQIECGSNVFVRLSDGTFEATVIKKGE
ncbi:MAG: exodeoxyribonuclease VII large subunit [Clostridia bacterium]|nr:exodeoxyribonuclease VII large subunit [Clostridia bacterium]